MNDTFAIIWLLDKLMTMCIIGEDGFVHLSILFKYLWTSFSFKQVKKRSDKCNQLLNRDCLNKYALRSKTLLGLVYKKSYGWGKRERVGYNKWMAVVEHLPARKITGKWIIYERTTLSSAFGRMPPLLVKEGNLKNSFNNNLGVISTQ